MLQTEKKLFVLYIILAILFILFTNKYYNFEETLMLRQNDGLSYMNIANYSFKFSQESLHYHHAQRFYIPYLIGLIGNTFNIPKYLWVKILIKHADPLNFIIKNNKIEPNIDRVNLFNSLIS